MSQDMTREEADFWLAHLGTPWIVPPAGLTTGQALALQELAPTVLPRQPSLTLPCDLMPEPPADDQD